MNREHILFAAVLALVGLCVALRAPEKPATRETPPTKNLEIRPVLGTDYPTRVLGGNEGRGPWTVVTNVRPHARPVEILEKPKDFDLPDIWPPTSRSVSLSRLDTLRRDAAPPQQGPATITLPQPGAAGGGGTGGPTEDRVDQWKSGTTDWKGRILAIVAGGATLKEPAFEERYGADVMKPDFKFWRALVLLSDPERATADEGVKAVQAKSAKMQFSAQAYPDEIGNFQPPEGKQQGYLRGLRVYLDTLRLAGAKGVQPRMQAGDQLLQWGLAETSKDSRRAYLNWALAILDEARKLATEGGGQTVSREILFTMLQAAGELNDYERVLALSTAYLAAFPKESEVLEQIGIVLSSRTFTLSPFAIELFKGAGERRSSQRRAIEQMVKEGRFEEAQEWIKAGRAGEPGAEQNLLRARVALALGQFADAESAARNSVSAGGAEAHQILGAVAYAQGDAAKAAQEFEQAAKADPNRSTAFSDWGLALAVAGKVEDSLVCFARAVELDPFNTVAPEIGRAYLKLAAGEASVRSAADADEAGRRDPKIKDEKAQQAATLRATAQESFAAASDMLTKLQKDNPKDLLVRYMLGYAKERNGNLKEAADLYRATIDGDSRYRIAIARLGLVQSERVLSGAAKDDLAPEAIAHLTKAVQLNTDDAILPYVLARFLMIESIGAGESGTDQKVDLANHMFKTAGEKPVTERNGNLPLWADLGLACLAYHDNAIEELKVKQLLNGLLDRIKDSMRGVTQEPQLMEHEVYRAARINLQIVEDNEKKVDKIWDFSELKPQDWKYLAVNPMTASVELGKGLVFGGQINYGGRERKGKLVLESCSAQYPVSKPEELTGGSFWELIVTGTADGPADFGIGLGQPGRTDEGLVGILLKRKASTGNLEIQLDGGDRQVFKTLKGKDPYEMKDVPWPAGEFKLKIEVVPEYGVAAAKRRVGGKFRLYLNDKEVFEQEFKDYAGERAAVFTQSRHAQPIQLAFWAEGREGYDIKGITVKTVTLTVDQMTR